MIDVTNLSKRYGATTAVDDLTFSVRPGTVTCFLGPNGAGKSTTICAIVGLDRPTSGTATIDGRRYADLTAPLHEVGTMLDGRNAHPGRTAYGHLMGLARTHGIGRARVEQVIGQAGLEPVARRRVGGFSLGMAQRLGIAAALLGDPHTLILDEPVNGLDPDGVLWVRRLLRSLADEGRTVFLSSHLMSELSEVAGRDGVLLRTRDAAAPDRGRRPGHVRRLRAGPGHDRRSRRADGRRAHGGRRRRRRGTAGDPADAGDVLRTPPDPRGRRSGRPAAGRADPPGSGRCSAWWPRACRTGRSRSV